MMQDGEGGLETDDAEEQAAEKIDGGASTTRQCWGKRSRYARQYLKEVA